MIMKHLWRNSAMVACLSLAGWGTWASDVETSLFSKGQSSLSLAACYGSFNNKDYAVVGVGAGYYLWDGLQAGLDGEAWLGSKPHLYSVSPGLRYVWSNFGDYKPYVGGFYKHSFYDTLPNLDSAGGRAGVIMTLSPRTYLSGGLVYEKYFNCDSTLYGDCSQVYPELGVTVAF